METNHYKLHSEKYEMLISTAAALSNSGSAYQVSYLKLLLVYQQQGLLVKPNKGNVSN